MIRRQSGIKISLVMFRATSDGDLEQPVRQSFARAAHPRQTNRQARDVGSVAELAGQRWRGRLFLQFHGVSVSQPNYFLHSRSGTGRASARPRSGRGSTRRSWRARQAQHGWLFWKPCNQLSAQPNKGFICAFAEADFSSYMLVECR